MNYAPAIPLGGYAGYAFLKRTMAAQTAAHAASPEMRRDEDYFRARIGSVTTAEALVSDRRLLKVALGAFGLDADINAKAFIRKVLTDGTLTTDGLANRLADKRYLAFSKAFGFGDYGIPRTQLSDFADGIVAAYKTRSFESAVGAKDNSLRLALNAGRELADLAGSSSGDTTKWLGVLGSSPLRQVFETALGLPAGFGAIDLDQQLATLREKTERAFGRADLAQFADPGAREALVRRYLVRAEVAANGGGLAAGVGALAILRAAPSQAVLSGRIR